VQGRRGGLPGLTKDESRRAGPIPASEEGGSAPGRKRAVVELIAQHGSVLRQVARRYSLCADDAEDAYQRTLEILLLKAPSDRARELLGWSRTVVKHEALAIRRNRQRLLGTPPAPGREGEERDWIAQIPAGGDGPAERLEQRELIARSREALQALKPAELRALTLLAEGYSYAEIGEITGFSRTKVNRCLAEGRERFRRIVSSSEDGSRCVEMRALLSAFCDGETSPAETAEVGEHLRACAGCRAAVRAYRVAPATVAALAPALPLSRSLLEKGHELAIGLHSRLFGATGAADASAAQVAASGGSRGAGMVALAKLLTICAGTVGGAACVAAGVVPAPIDVGADRSKSPRIERVSERVIGQTAPSTDGEATAAEPDEPASSAEVRSPDATEPAPSETETGAVEYTGSAPAPPSVPAPTPIPSPSSESQGSSSGSAAGEFGP
jgi:RNA polymerase sigma factor (sigma-70 family)